MWKWEKHPLPSTVREEFPMPSPTPLKLTVTDPTERLLVEQALAFARDLRTTAASSPDGRVLRNAESFCVVRGREFLLAAMKMVLEAEADAVEKKGPGPALPVRFPPRQQRPSRPASPDHRG